MLYSDPEYCQEILALIEPLEGFSWRMAMGDYYLLYEDKIIGGIFCNRLLVKITPASLQMLAPTAYCIPYSNKKEMLLVESRDSAFLKELVMRTAAEIPIERPYRHEDP